MIRTIHYRYRIPAAADFFLALSNSQNHNKSNKGGNLTTDLRTDIKSEEDKIVFNYFYI